MANINDELLQRELRNHRISNTEYADMLGISKTALWRKRTGISDFTRKEICITSSLIGKTNVMKIFF